MRDRVWLAAFLALMLLAAGCGGAADLDQPPEIAYGEDVCHRCQMIISDERFAAAYWTPEGEARLFDDAGEMLLYQVESGEEAASVWVHDLTDGQWLAADQAVFVVHGGLATPMGFDVAAFADRAAAEALAYGQDGAVALTYAELLAQAASGELVLDPRRRHEEG